MASGHECDYENVPRPMVFDPEASANNPHAPRAPIPLVPTDPLEQRSLAYFREKTAPNLTGFTSFTNTFWTSLVPQLGQYEPAVRHITIAVAAKHEIVSQSRAAEPDSLPEELSTLCIGHYSLAVRALTQPPPTTNTFSAEVLLVCCVAFIAFERLQSRDLHSTQYVPHVIAGLRILEQQERQNARDRASSKREPPKEFNLIDSFIEPMFFQIKFVLSMFRQPERLVISSTCGTDPHVRMAQTPEIPQAGFSSLKMAEEIFHRICWWRYYLSLKSSEHSPVDWSSFSGEFKTIQLLLANWDVALHEYISSLDPTDDHERCRSIALLEQAQLLAGALLYSTRDDIPESCYCRPVSVELLPRSRISISIRIPSERTFNLSGINNGRSSVLKPNDLWLWPKAKRIRGVGRYDYIVLDMCSNG